MNVREAAGNCMVHNPRLDCLDCLMGDKAAALALCGVQMIAYAEATGKTKWFLAAGCLFPLYSKNSALPQHFQSHACVPICIFVNITA